MSGRGLWGQESREEISGPSTYVSSGRVQVPEASPTLDTWGVGGTMTVGFQLRLVTSPIPDICPYTPSAQEPPHHFSDSVLLLHLRFQILETFLHSVMEGSQILRHPFFMELNTSSQEGNLERDSSGNLMWCGHSQAQMVGDQLSQVGLLTRHVSIRAH